ncbi:LAMI_0G07448g1_1 [Lachancea mirantina]|uniref:LAMI_0G07448g1_1 n=1 Tax=Lachancea mirantina TaxID=1230905 RepID=A0A1G4K9J1_9SACH|nr:LAMI_0G07448g1_1 [Lachancea mirantina]
MVQPNPYILGRFLDPLFAFAVGTISYYSYERKVGREPGHTLNELISKRWNRMNQKADS